LEQKFPKAERLSSKKIIQELFDKGSSLYLYPFRLLYLHTEPPPSFPQVLFTVPKRQFKKAVTRNLIRRRLREAYRLNKAAVFLHPEKKIPAFVAIIYIAKEEIPFDLIEKKLILALKRLG
jgi:ribonuclease P protein component